MGGILPGRISEGDGRQPAALRSKCLNTQKNTSSKAGLFDIGVKTHTDGKPARAEE